MNMTRDQDRSFYTQQILTCLRQQLLRIKLDVPDAFRLAGLISRIKCDYDKLICQSLVGFATEKEKDDSIFAVGLLLEIPPFSIQDLRTIYPFVTDSKQKIEVFQLIYNHVDFHGEEINQFLNLFTWKT